MALSRAWGRCTPAVADTRVPHHAIHHDPRWMSRAGLGVTTPPWDWLRGIQRS